MNRYRYPGLTTVPESCNKPKECKPYICIKACPPPPRFRDKMCRPNVYDRAVIHIVPESLKCKYDAEFLLETFSGLVLLPKNLDKFCGYNFKDGEVVAVEAEVIPCEKPTECHKNCSCEKCKPKKCSCGKCGNITTSTTVNATDFVTPDDVIFVKIFKIARVWKLEKRKLTGIVLLNTDANGVEYHMIREVTDLSLRYPYPLLTENKLNIQKVVVHYEIVNIMNVDDPQQTMRDLVGKTIEAEYVDYGRETLARLGIPIVIFDYKIVS